MTHTISQEEPIVHTKQTEPLSGRQKFIFTIICWGVESWGKARNFKASGYEQKYKDARKSMHTGLVIYGIGILLFVLLLL